MTCTSLVFAVVLALNPSWTDDMAMRYVAPICEQSEKHDIDPLIIVSVIHHESSWRADTKNKNKNGSTDYGPMQFNCPKDIADVNMKWRRYWCKRKKRLTTDISIGIAAGTRELRFWKDICIKKHKGYNFLYIIKDCLDCRLIATKLYGSPNAKSNIEFLIKNHWWVQHYNWKSKDYGLRVLYVYRVLLEERIDNYPMLRSRFYSRLSKMGLLEECLLKDDLCLGVYEEWRKKKKATIKRSLTSLKEELLISLQRMMLLGL